MLPHYEHNDRYWLLIHDVLANEICNIIQASARKWPEFEAGKISNLHRPLM